MCNETEWAKKKKKKELWDEIGKIEQVISVKGKTSDKCIHTQAHIFVSLVV